MEDNSTFFDIILYIGYIMVAVAALAAVVLPLVKSIGDPRSLLTMGAGLLAVIVIFLIGYALADNEVLPFYSRYEIEASGSKLIGGTLITMYILVLLALVGIAVTEVSKLFR